MAQAGKCKLSKHEMVQKKDFLGRIFVTCIKCGNTPVLIKRDEKYSRKL